MPSRNSFSFRRLLTAPRRRSYAIGDVTLGTHTGDSYSNSNSGGGGGGGSTGPAKLVKARKDRKDRNGRKPSDTSGDLASTTNVLDQSEVDRIRAVVAAAAASAASSIRLRAEEDGNDSEVTIHVDGGSVGAAKEEQHTRKRNRPPPQPIVVDRPGDSDLEQRHGRPSAEADKKTSSPSGSQEDKVQSQQQERKEPFIPDTPHSSLLSSSSSLCSCESQTGPQPRETAAAAYDDCLYSPNNTTAAAPLRAPTPTTDPCTSSPSSFTSSPLTSFTPSPTPGRPSPFCDQPQPLRGAPFTPPTPPTPNTPFTPVTPITRSASKGRKASHSKSRSRSHGTNKPYTYSSRYRYEMIHPAQRQRLPPMHQHRHSDNKKDSGVDLDTDGSTTYMEPRSSAHSDELDSLFSFSEGPRLDLLEALSIKPEEAVYLHQEYQQQQYRHHTTASGNNMLPIPPRKSSSGAVITPNAAPLPGPVTSLERQPSQDECCSPTFTRPRRAPTPLVQSAAPAATTSDTKPAATSSVSPPRKTQPKFLPRGFSRSASVKAARAQRKRSMKARRRERKADLKSVNNASSLQRTKSVRPAQGGRRDSRRTSSSRWVIPDNVAELFDGRRLFNRMEVNETLPPEKLREIRESRQINPATLPKQVAQTETEQVHEPEPEVAAESMTEDKAEAQEIVQQQQTTKPEPPVEEPQPNPQSEPEMSSQTAQLLPVPAQAAPHRSTSPASAASSARHSDETLNTVGTDDSETPIELFYLEDLPNRIGAAGVRMSVLLPVQEEAAYFTQNAKEMAEAKARRRLNEPEVTDVVLPSAPPPPPQKNPLRFTKKEHANKDTETERGKGKGKPAIPDLTLTDVDNTNQHVVIPRTPGAFSHESAMPTPLAVSGSAVSMAVMRAELACEGDPENIYLPSTPYSMIMPGYRHGQIRLPKPEQADVRTPRIAADDTLDWTAFQMAILGGTNDLFSDSVDYGRSPADAAEMDDLACWFYSLGLSRGRLLRDEQDEASVALEESKSLPAEMEGSPVVPPEATGRLSLFNEHTPGFWNRAVPDGNARGSQDMYMAGLPQLTFDPPPTRPFSMDSGRTSASTGSLYSCSGARVVGSDDSLPHIGSAPLMACQAAEHQLESAPDYKQPVMRRRRKTPPSLPLTKRQPATPTVMQTSELLRASMASFESFESMPQSPLADLMMSRAVDGTEYAVPMGYNLGHDLGEFLKWESENVCAMTLD